MSGDESGVDPRTSAPASPRGWSLLLPLVLLLLAAFSAYAIQTMIAVSSHRSTLESYVAHLQRLGVLQKTAGEWLADGTPTPPDAWGTLVAEVRAELPPLAQTTPELAADLAALESALARVSAEAGTKQLGELQTATSDVVSGLRRQTAMISEVLGEDWDDLLRIAVAALLLAALTALLVAYAERRRRQALGLAEQVSRAAEELAETRAALRERQALARVADELREARDVAEAAAEAKRRFTATMSHELLTPLNVIIGYAELLRERHLESEADDELADVERIRAAGLNLHRLLRQVLELTEIDDRELRLERDEVPLQPLLERIVGELRPLAEERGNRVEVRAPAELGLHSDLRRLTTVLAEIINNACRFTRDGVVEIEATSADGGVAIVVRDNGPGMAEGDRIRAFEAYFQADTSSTRGHDGAGLGLTVAERICVRLGGTIALESAVDRGTSVRLWIPDRPDEDPEASARATRSSPRAPP